MQTIKNQIEYKINKSSQGVIFFADDFAKYGSSENIRQILSRLEKENVFLII